MTFTRPLTLDDAQRAWIKAHPVIDYTTYANAAPMTFRDASGEPAGLSVEVLAAIGKLTGLRFEGRLRASTDQVMGDIRNGSAMLIAHSVSSGEVPPELVSTRPYGEGVFVILTRVGAPPLRDVRALAGKRIALWRNHPIIAMLRERVPSARIVAASPVDGQFDAVVKGEADATIADLPFANYAVGDAYRGKLVITGAFSEQPVPYGFLVARNQPMLLTIMNQAIEHMQPTELDAMRRRWVLVNHPESLWERRRPQVLLGLLLGGLMLALLTGWAVSLKAQIARRRAAEHAMRVAKEEAETANRAKSMFLATMSHEIRTPMNAVLGLLELELRSPGDRASTERAFGTAHQAARDLLGMIDDILDMAKIEAGRLVLIPAPLELGGWVNSVAAIYEQAARSKGIALVVRMRGGLAHGHAWAMADALRLRQVLGNLLSNAIKFTETGHVTLEYAIGAAKEGDKHTSYYELLLVVRDTGIGIAADQQALLFEPFAQARQERPGRFGGTGLGLTICLRLMTLMGGTIRLSSRPGQGSRFTVRVRLPVARPPVEPHAPALIPALDTHDLQGLRVLIVDDHPANRILLASQLTTLGCVIETTNDGDAAFARWDRQRQEGLPFDLILTDCSMPTMSGEDLVRAIRAREQALMRMNADVTPTPIVGVTANAQAEALTQALAAGMTLCLVKPLGLDALHRALVAALHDGQEPKASAPDGSLLAASRVAPMHMSTASAASAGSAGRSGPGRARAVAYGPTQNFPANIVVRRVVLPAPGTTPEPDQLATPATVPRFNADQLNSFGDQAAALVDALKSANRQDLDVRRAGRSHRRTSSVCSNLRTG